MKSPKGFGRNYFIFSAILAYAVQSKLQSQVSSVSSVLHNKIVDEDDEIDENDPSCDILENVFASKTKPCHCNCFYKLKTKIALLINIFIPRCPFYKVCFAFRRTGVHPPFFHY